MIGPCSLEVALGWQAAFCLRLHRFQDATVSYQRIFFDRVAFSLLTLEE